MLKNELRTKYKNLRAGITPPRASDLSLMLANQILKIPIWDFFYFHVFLGSPQLKEVDTLPLITILQARDKHVLVPRVSGPDSLEHYLLTDATHLAMNRWGIAEPQDGIQVPEQKIDVVFLPLLAFDLSGNRVGYGKGFYDAFLEKCRPDTLKIGLSYFGAEESPIGDVREEDKKLDYCISPERIYEF